MPVEMNYSHCKCPGERLHGIWDWGPKKKAPITVDIQRERIGLADWTFMVHLCDGCGEVISKRLIHSDGGQQSLPGVKVFA